MPPTHPRNDRQTVIEPAPLSVRFSAAILDIGLLVFVVIFVSLAWRLMMDIPLGEIRYKPPGPDDAHIRLLKSILLYIGLGAYVAAWVASPLQATPGMLPLHVQVHNRQGSRIGFWRAMGWFLVAFAPLALAACLVLAGLALGVSLIHISLLSVFSALILLQSGWFLWMFAGPDRRTVHDTICAVAVDHKTRPFSHPLLKHIAFLPLSGVAVVFLSSILFIASLNLVDQKLDSSLRFYDSITSDTANLFWEFQRDNAPYSVYRGGIDFSCGAHDPRFYRKNCPDDAYIAKTLRDNRHLINAYRYNFERYNAGSEELIPYIYRESIKLTDLALIRLLKNFEKGDEQEKEFYFNQWLRLAQSWSGLMRQPHFLGMKTSISIQLNHVLQALPIFLDQKPELLEKYYEEIMEVIQPVDLDQTLADQIIAFEYIKFKKSLRYARIEYFPLILPNATRNLFVYKRQQLEQMLAQNNFATSRLPVIPLSVTQTRDDLSEAGPFSRMILSLYNPLGRAIYNEIDKTTRKGIITFSAYRLSNSLRRMLEVMIMIKKRNLGPEDIPEFLENLPPELRFPFKNQEIHYNAKGRYLYHGAPGFTNTRRIVHF